LRKQRGGPALLIQKENGKSKRSAVSTILTPKRVEMIEGQHGEACNEGHRGGTQKNPEHHESGEYQNKKTGFGKKKGKLIKDWHKSKKARQTKKLSEITVVPKRVKAKGREQGDQTRD